MVKIKANMRKMHIQGVPKKVAIGPPKPQFLSETFEIITVGRLFYSGFSIFSDLKNFDFKGHKLMFEIFRISQKKGCSFFIFLSEFFWEVQMPKKIQIIRFSTKI